MHTTYRWYHTRVPAYNNDTAQEYYKLKSNKYTEHQNVNICVVTLLASVSKYEECDHPTHNHLSLVIHKEKASWTFGILCSLLFNTR